MRRCALIASAIVLVALAGAPGADAHSLLVESFPGNDSALQSTPPAILLRFNEPVETAFGSVRIYDCNAKRVDSGQVRRPDARTVAASIGRQLPNGTYTVTWRVISDDAHPVAGAFIFHIRTPCENSSGVAMQVLGKGTPGSVSGFFKFTRALDFALILLVVGGAAVLALVLRSAASELRARLYRILAGLAVGLVIAGIFCVVLQGAVAGGFGLSEAFRGNTVDSVLQTRFGKAFLVQMVFAGVVGLVAFALSRARNRVVGLLALAPAVFLLPTLSAAGHARTSGSAAAAADLVHLAAASSWAGGLGFVVLALLLAGEDRWPLASRAVPIFSILAVVSVAALIFAGVIRGYEEVRAWHGLWDTTYGRLLLAKIGLVLPLLGLGAFNNRYAVPRLRAQTASVGEQRRFLRVAGGELAIIAAIVGVTAVLVSEPPAKTTDAPKFFAKTFPIGNLEVNVVVDPAATGTNLIHLYFSTQSGLQADLAEAKITASLPGEELGPLRFQLQKVVPSHYTTAAAVFPLSGDWQLRIEARRGKSESLTQIVSVPIRKG